MVLSALHSSPALELERLLAFGLKNGFFVNFDKIYIQNQVMDLLKIDEPFEDPLDIESLEIPDTVTPILDRLLDYAAEKGLMPEDTHTQRSLLDTRIMGLMLPRPSQVSEKFNAVKAERGVKAATDWFYKLNEKADYIRINHIAKNIKWLSPSKYGTLEITINLSKPEKDPREIAALKNAAASGYPKCLLCIENVGYPGRINHPARQSLRVLPLSLHGEDWYFQYSPYVYYHQHCIVFNEKHIPMKISKGSFERLFDFIDLFPHYFIGSNADLPIVGGSILNHDHFQGGFYQFPMEKAPVQIPLAFEKSETIQAGIVAWPMSVLRLSGQDRQALVQIASRVLDAWRAYSDPSVDVLSHSPDGTPHNTITPIVRRNGKGEYEIDLVLRNNRTSEEHPLGIFHPHSQLFHIKKENIGLIEVMGLFILPGRLQTELKEIELFLSGEKAFDKTACSSEDHPLHKHLPWIEQLLAQYGTAASPERAKEILQDEVAQKCVQVLEHAGVYKDDQQGRDAFLRFLKTLGFHPAS